MKGEAPLSMLTGVPGWETIAEQQLLKKYARRVPIGGAILEIGSEFGMSASILRKFSFPDIQLVCVEMNPKAPFMHNLKKAELDFRVHPVIMESSKFFGWWTALKADSFGLKSAQFDLIFIDGDHSYSGALLDLQEADLFLKDSGVLLLHDTACASNRDPHLLHYDVSRAVASWWDQEKYMLLETADSMMVFQKRVSNA